MNKESALAEFYGWFENAEMYTKTAASEHFIPYPQVALTYLQMAAEFTFKGIIVSLTGRPLPSRNPYVLCTRCRRLLPGLQVAARLYSPKKQALLCFLDPAYRMNNKEWLPRDNEWKQLLQLVKQLQKVTEPLCRARIEAVFR